jgi:betaine-aldehyde dehydrogenase/5-carboxymethyl-2-hydroxymuconic-semialdehyde dehydrogenase
VSSPRSPAGGAKEADAAARAAHAAFPAWAALGPQGRAPYLHRLADLIDANVERLAEVECLDMAMLLRSLRARVIGPRRPQLPRLRRPRRRLRGARLALQRHLEPRPAHARRPGRGDHAVERAVHALDLEDGTGAGRGLHDGAQAREWSPLSCSLLADLIAEADFPPGVFNIIQGIGEEVGAALVSHPLLRRVSFTGSPETGRRIGVAAAGNLVPFTAELGGKGPLIVFEDADLDAAAKKAAGQYDDSGQVCLAGTRLLIQDSIRDEFLTRFHAYVDEHVLGDPREDTTTLSPLIHPTTSSACRLRGASARRW